MMRTVLVTGSTGALGQSVIKHLRKDGSYNIVAASRGGNGDVELDVSDEDQMISVINQFKPDLILHLAATFANDFEQAFSVNVEATRTLLESVKHSGSKTRVLLIGSAAEYGVIHPDENPVSEDHVLNPVSVYGLTKAWQTQLAKFYTCQGVDVVVARVFNLYGENISERLFIGRLQKQISEVLAGRQSVIELGPLTAGRDYLSTEEATFQILCVANQGESGCVYNIASGEPVIMRDILKRYLDENNLGISIVRESTGLSNRAGYDVPMIYADISRTLALMEGDRE